MAIYYTEPNGQGQRINVPRGKCYEGKAVNRMTEEQRNALGLYSYIQVHTPTIEEQRENMVVTPWQMRKAINQLGLRDQVDAAIAAAPIDWQDGWEVATSFERDNTLVVQLAQGLGLSEEDLDGLFELASTL